MARSILDQEATTGRALTDIDRNEVHRGPPCPIASPNANSCSVSSYYPPRYTLLVGFINPGSPMDPLPYKTRPSSRRIDSTRLGWPRYTMTGQDHDPVPDRHLRPGDLIGGAIGRPGRGGTAVRFRPTFSDREYVRTSTRCSFVTDMVEVD